MKRVKEIICSFLAITLLFMSLLPLTAQASEINLEEGIIVNNTEITHSVQDGAYYTYVPTNVLEALRNSRTVYARSTVNVNEELLKAIGLDDDDIATMGEDEVNYLGENASSITVVDRYYQVDEEGNVDIITKEEYNVMEENQISLCSNGGDNTELQSDGAFRITSLVTYINPAEENEQKGWFVFSGLFAFVGMPSFRMEDAASLYADDVMWSQDNSEYYSILRHEYSNYVTGENFISSETKDGNSEDMHLYADGLYYTWQLPTDYKPNGMSVKVVTDIRIYVRGKARVSDYTNERAFNMFTRYEHTFHALSIQPSFTWTNGEKPGVSVEVSMEENSNTYDSVCEVLYNPSSL